MLRPIPAPRPNPRLSNPMGGRPDWLDLTCRLSLLAALLVWGGLVILLIVQRTARP